MISFAELKTMFNTLSIEVLEYLRKSRADSESETVDEVLNKHERILKDFMKNTFNYEIPSENIYKEVVSGETIDERIEMQKVLKRIEDGNIFALVIIEPQRLSRGDRVDIGTIERTLLYSNTIVITPTKIYDLKDPYDRKIFLMELEQGSEYLDYIKTILQRGRRRSFEEGYCINAKPCFGYDKHKVKQGYTLVPNDDAQTVRDMFDLYIKNDGNLYKTKTHFELLLNKSITAHQFRYMLRNKTYIGYNIWGRNKQKKQVKDGKIISTRVITDDYSEVKGLHEPIVSLEAFNHVQALLDRPDPRQKKNHPLQNPLATILKCDKCGHAMQRFTTPRGIVLRCPDTFCDNVSSYLNIVEEKVFKALADELATENQYLANYEKEIIKEQKNYTNTLAKIQKQIETLDKKQSRICEFYELGDYTREIYIERTNAITNEKKSLEKQIEAINNEMKNNKVEVIRKRIPKLQKCLKDYDILSPEDKNKLLKTIVNEIKYRKDFGGRKKGHNVDEFTLEIIFLD